MKLTSPGFLALLAAQFCSIATEYAFKATLVLFILSVIADEGRQVRYATAMAMLFPLPVLFFSPLAGYFADRFPKHRVLLSSRIPDLIAMALASFGFYLRSLPILFSALFVKATAKTFFSPAGYGILPEVLDDSQISAGNGALELSTNAAALTGSILGAYAFGRFASNLHYAGLLFLAVAGAGTFVVLLVPRAPAGNREAMFAWNAFSSLRSDYVQVRSNPTLYYVLIGIAWFGLVTSFFATSIPLFGESSLGVQGTDVALMVALMSIGFGFGAAVAGQLSHQHVELGLVPIGAVGITIFALLIGLSGMGPVLAVLGLPRDTAIGLVLLGFSTGLFLVPLNAMLQQRAPLGMKGRLVAFSNILRYGAVMLAATVPWILETAFGWNIRQSILFVAIVTFAATAYVIFKLPDFLSRLLVWILTNSIYRIRTVGVDNQPKYGALLVCNHVSLIDSFLVAASTSRMVRFFVPRAYYEYKLLNWFFRIAHAIPFAPTDSHEETEAAFERARNEVRNGHVVCIFAEGAVTRTGNLLRFGRGLEQVAIGANCPVIPIYLDGVWGSIFSYERGRFVFKWPRKLFQPITVVYGKPMPSTVRADEVRHAIQDLSTETFRYHKQLQKPLHIAFVRRAKRRWRSVLATEAGGSRITFGAALTRAITLSRTLGRSGESLGAKVGILLPPGIDAMLANLATLFAGHIPVNMDLTDVAHSAASRAQLAAILTTRAFARTIDSVEKLSPAEVKYLEDAEASVGTARHLATALLCRLMPRRLIGRMFVRGSRTDVDQVATILFSYRADDPDPPRGVMLTHHNLLSNMESLRQVFRVTHYDCILGLIPFANSMSYVTTFLLPALTGARVAFAEKLVGTSALGPFCGASQISLIPTSPELLASILHTVDAADLSHLRRAFVGGGRRDDELCGRFFAKFGIEPLHGYGYPECAPLISLNVPDYHQGHLHQPGTRPGTAGHPVPGVSVRIVDSSTGEPVPQGGEGLLLVRGPNVMKGYLEGSEVTQRILNDGWFITGDRAHLDEDGFLTITTATVDAPNDGGLPSRPDPGQVIT